MAYEGVFVNPYDPNRPQMAVAPPTIMEQLYAAEKFVSDDGLNWSFTPPKAEGFFDSMGSRWEYKQLEFQSGLTGRHLGAEQYMEILADPTNAAQNREEQSGLRDWAGLVLPWPIAGARYDIDGKISEKDEDFNPDEVLKFTDPTLIQVAERQDPDIVRKLKQTSNQFGFNYVLNSTLKKKQLLDQIAADDAAGLTGGWTTSTASALVNYMVLDEDTLRTAGLGTVIKGAAATLRGAGKVLPKIALTMEAASRSRDIGILGRAGSYTGQKLTQIPARPMLAAELALKNHMGVKRAAVAQFALFGGMWDVGYQTGAINLADALYGPDQTEVTYSPAHTLGAVAAGAGLGWGIFYGLPKLSRFFRGRNVDRDHVPHDVAGMVEDGTMKMSNIARQYADDTAMSEINTRLASMALESDMPVTMGWALSRDILDANGRTVDELSRFVDALFGSAEAAGVKLDEGAIGGALMAFMEHGEAAIKAAAGDRRALAARIKARTRKALAENDNNPRAALEALDMEHITRSVFRIRNDRTADPAKQAIADEVNALMRAASKAKGQAKRDLIWRARQLSDKHGLTETALVAGRPEARRTRSWRELFENKIFGTYRGDDRARTIYMTPDEYATFTHPYPGDPAKVARLDGLVEEGTLINELPSLRIHRNEKTGELKVTGHEGRHRMELARRQGVEYVPVTVRLPDDMGRTASTSLEDLIKAGRLTPEVTSQKGERVKFITRETEPGVRTAGRPERSAAFEVEERLFRAIEEEMEDALVKNALLGELEQTVAVRAERAAVHAQLDKLGAELAERRTAMEEYFVKTAVEEATARRKAVKVFTDPEARNRILKYAESAEDFAALSEQHAKFQAFLADALDQGIITQADARMLRAIMSQSDGKMLSKLEYMIESPGAFGENLGGVLARSSGGGTIKRVLGVTKDMTDPVETIMHELLHAGAYVSPGIRSEFIKLHQKLIRNPRKLAKARAFYTRYLESLKTKPEDIDNQVAYFLHDADEFWAEFGSRYLIDSKFRNMMVEAIDDTAHPLYRMAKTFTKAINKVVPFVQEFEFGFSIKETEKFFSLVDQAMGFKPVARRKYLFNSETPEHVARSLVYRRSVGEEVQASRLRTEYSAEEAIFKMLDDIKAAREAGDTKKALALEKKMRRATAARRGTAGEIKFYDSMTPLERSEALNKIFDNLNETQAEVIANSSAVAKMLLGTRLGRAINRAVVAKQGLNETLFSRFAELRAITSLFDASKFGMSRIGKTGPKTLQGAKNWALREYEPVASALQRLRTKARSQAAYNDANKQMVILMSQGKKVAPSDHPLAKEMNEAMSLWTRYMEQMADRGVRVGLIKDLADDAFYIPMRLDPAKIRGNERTFRNRLVQYWLVKAENEADDTLLNINVMRDSLKWVSQKLDKNGRPTGKAIVDETIIAGGKLPKTRGELRAMGGAFEAQYNAALKAPVAEFNGLTALEHAAQNYIRRQMGEEGFTGGVREFNKRLDQGRFARADVTRGGKARRFTQEEIFIDSPELAEFYNMDLFELGFNYANSTGFRVHAQDVLEDITSTRGITWFEFLNTAEQRLRDRYGMDTGADYEISSGFEKLHEVLADLNGGLPHVDSGYSKIERFGAEFARQGALTAYGSGIGTTILGVENMWSTFAKVHSPGDLIDNIVMLVKSYLPGLRSKAVREELEGTIMGLKRLQQHSANRFVTGSVDGPGHLHWMDGITRPWKTAIDTIRGDIVPGQGQSRMGASVLRTMEALGQTAQTVGLNRIFNETGWIMQSHATRREFNRYFDRALRLADDLAERPIVMISDDSTFVAGTQAQRAKSFKGRARQAGFGDRWDIARRFDEANLLDRESLEILQQLRNKTESKGWSSGDLRNAAFDLPLEQQDKAFEVLNNFNTFVETEVLKRISEASSLYKATDKASRTFIGAALNSMFSFSRSFYTNAILDAPGMPSRVFLGMLSSYMFFEILTSVARGALDGEDPDDIAERWKNDPVGELMSGGARVPLLGAYSAIPRYAVDATRQALGNEDVKMFGYSPYQSAATGAMDRMIQTGVALFQAPMKWASGEEDAGEIGRDLWEHSRTFIPAAGSFYGELIQMTIDDEYGERRR